MKKIALIFFLFTFFTQVGPFSSCQASADSAQPGEPSGFGGMVWGQSPDGVEGLVRERVLPGNDPGDAVYYTVKDDPMRLGDAVLSSVIYVFREDRFKEVMIQIDGSRNLDAAIRWLVESYGVYDHVDGSGYFWFFPSVTILYSEDGTKALLLYLSK